jgi:hypothetical protein
MGVRGTVVGVHGIGNVLLDVVFDVQFVGARIIRCAERAHIVTHVCCRGTLANGYRVPATSVINLSPFHGRYYTLSNANQRHYAQPQRQVYVVQSAAPAKPLSGPAQTPAANPVVNRPYPKVDQVKPKTDVVSKVVEQKTVALKPAPKKKAIDKPKAAAPFSKIEQHHAPGGERPWFDEWMKTGDEQAPKQPQQTSNVQSLKVKMTAERDACFVRGAKEVDGQTESTSECAHTHGRHSAFGYSRQGGNAGTIVNARHTRRHTQHAADTQRCQPRHHVHICRFG